jgi:SAM-dependent methyltransferase
MVSGESGLRDHDWDSSYQGDRPPWDLGRPQPVFVELADSGVITSPVLDSGCGTGEHALLFAERGHEVMGVDISPRAIEQAKEKAATRDVEVTFLVGDVLELPELGRRFASVIDCGVFHVFDDEDRVRYVGSLAAAIGAGGDLHLLCMSEQTPGDSGPRRVTQAELFAAFQDGWEVDDIRPARIEVSGDWWFESPHAWLAHIIRTG